MTGFYWLVAYPKSGHTWLRLALWSLWRGGSAIDLARSARLLFVAASRMLFDEALLVDSTDLTAEEIACLRPRQFEQEAADAVGPLLRKVHEGWLPTPAGEPMFPPSVTLGTVYVARDPRDVAVSLSHYFRWSLDTVIAYLADPGASMGQYAPSQLKQPLSTWSHHAESWLGAPGMPTPLLLRYEDMIADMPTQLGRVAAYLGWTVEPAAVTAAVEATRFEVLAAAETVNGFIDRPALNDRFFRRGRAGGWRDTLTAAQARQIERDHGRMMTRLGYL